MRFLQIAITILFALSAFLTTAFADDVSECDYFFIYNGAAFTHEMGKPVEGFEYHPVPFIKPYSNIIQIGDMTSDGSLVAVLKGDKEHLSRFDLVIISPDLKLSPLFALIKREKLPDGYKVDRSFGSVDIDPQTKKVVFSVIERTSKIGATTEADYLSKIYRIPLRGGSCETIGEFKSQCVTVTAGGGIVAITIPAELPNGIGIVNMIKMLPENSSNWVDINIQDLDMKSIDLSDDGKSLLLLGKAPNGIYPFKLLEISALGKTGNVVDMLDEFTQTEVGSDYRYTLSGDSIIYRRKCAAAWGDTWVNFLYDSEIGTFPLVRSDLCFEYTPLKSRRAGEIEFSLAGISLPIKSIDAKGRIQQCGSSSDNISIFVDINDENKTLRVLDSKFVELKSCEINSNDNLHGTYFNNGDFFSIAQIELGEKLLSFESISYGKLIVNTPDNKIIERDIHLAWNIGGRMLGIEIPENNMCIGGDKDNLHLVLYYPSHGIFPVSDYVTPLYFLRRDNWMIEHPLFLPKAKESSCYFVRGFDDSDGNLYLLDSLNSVIVKYTENRKKRLEYGWLPDSLPSLSFPSDMALIDNNIHVLDPLNSRVVIYNLDGEPVKIIILDAFHTLLDNTRLGDIDENGLSIIDIENKHEIRFEFAD